MYKQHSVLLIICLFAFATQGFAADFASSYGMIKNVSNYSTMPGWTPDSPYNLASAPRAVYVMGPDLGSGDCQGAVASVVESYCSANNDCQNMQFSDARPAMMVTLSRLPGHSFATACTGYLDGAFKKYVDEHSSKFSTTQPVTFPGVKYVPTSEPKKKTNWMTEYAERSAELENLQAQNGAGSEQLYSANMPATFADLDFATRQKILAAGYEPYKDASAYQTIKVESLADYTDRLKKHADMVYEEKLRQFCLENPKDAKCVNKSQSSETTKDDKDAARKQLIERILETLPK